MTAAAYAARAAAGAAFLDEQVPGWAGRVELATLSLHSDCSCILGQLSDGGCYHDTLDDLHLDDDAAAQLGFTLDTYGDWEDWAELDAAWAREIVTRREATEVTP